jgi:2-haloacid dehalogenase/putative hydrolase of the HAD superfamily
VSQSIGYEGLLLDFYGTLVEEDNELVADIARRVAEASPRAPAAAEVGAEWSRGFAALCERAHGSRFATQRELEQASLRELLARFGCALDPEALSAELFAYWRAPRPLPGAAEFLRALRVPVCVVSNIDAGDLGAAVSSLGWSFERIVTSEGCRAYKPRAELFEAGLARLGLARDAVLHAGDSLRSDVGGAAAAGISAAWVNPRRRRLPAGAARPAHEVASVSALAAVLA